MVQIQYSSCNFAVGTAKGTEQADLVIVPCLWKLNDTRADDDLNFCTIDLIFGRSTPVQDEQRSSLPAYTIENLVLFLLSKQNGKAPARIPTENSAVLKFLLKVVLDLHNSQETAAAVKLVLPTKTGTIARSNYFETRLEQCMFADSVESFWEPLYEVTKINLLQDGTDSPFSLSSHLSLVCCGIQTKFSANHSSTESLDSLEDELYNRISSEWILPGKIERKVIAFLEGPPKQETASTLLDAAKYLGIDLIIIDYAGHWMERPENSHFCKAFLPIDMTADVHLGPRAAQALLDSGLAAEVSAIVSCRDGRLVHAATAMEILGISTKNSPPNAFRIATDKYLTRTFDTSAPSLPVCLKFSDVPTLQHQLSQLPDSPSIFPLVVKPCHGGGSEGVSKVQDVDSLLACVESWYALEALSYRHGRAMCAETYVSGPEVDANFILFDGEVLFFELVDDFPCPADQPDAVASATFVEGGMFYPSALPPAEHALVRQSIHASLLKMGFRNGVFHCEARVMNSTVQHSTRPDGLIDVLPASPAPSSPPAVFLLEVNARPCGLQGIFPCRVTHGVCYYDALLLCALNDTARAHALTRPFRHAPLGFCELVYISSPVGGVFKTAEPPCEELMRRVPDLAEYVVAWWNLRKQGDVVPDPGTKRDVLQPWIAAMVVRSGSSREDALVAAGRVRKEFRYELE
ncbi:ATP-grasp domain-containing protein [Geopyxis carbonaria]|nr:ATP-grasp domain-containing protein [Geopyxis carbonaria]